MSRVRNTRWKCPHCGSEGWSTPALDGARDHDRPDGRRCAKAHLNAKKGSAQ